MARATKPLVRKEHQMSRIIVVFAVAAVIIFSAPFCFAEVPAMEDTTLTTLQKDVSEIKEAVGQVSQDVKNLEESDQQTRQNLQEAEQRLNKQIEDSEARTGQKLEDIGKTGQAIREDLQKAEENLSQQIKDSEAGIKGKLDELEKSDKALVDSLQAAKQALEKKIDQSNAETKETLGRIEKILNGVRSNVKAILWIVISFFIVSVLVFAVVTVLKRRDRNIWIIVEFEANGAKKVYKVLTRYSPRKDIYTSPFMTAGEKTGKRGKIDRNTPDAMKKHYRSALKKALEDQESDFAKQMATLVKGGKIKEAS